MVIIACIVIFFSFASVQEKMTSVNNIGNSAFEGCELLKNVVIPKSTINIGNNAFKNCINIIDLVIDNNESLVLNNRSFYDCNKLNTAIRFNNKLMTV